jgi:hypothetical protein
MEQIAAWLESEEKDYATGVQLLLQHGKNRVLANTLARKESSYFRDKLEYELKKTLDASGWQPAVATVSLEQLQQQLKEVLIKGIQLHQSLPEGETNDELNDLTLKVDELMEKIREIEPDFTPFEFIHSFTDKTGNEPALDAGLPEQAQPVQTVAVIDAIILRQSDIYTERALLSNTLADIATDEERKVVVDKIEALTEEYNKLAEKKARIEAGTEPAETANDQPLKPMDKGQLLLTRNNLRSQLSKAQKALDNAPDNAEKQEKVAKLKLQLQDLEIQIKLS